MLTVNCLLILQKYFIKIVHDLGSMGVLLLKTDSYDSLYSTAM